MEGYQLCFSESDSAMHLCSGHFAEQAPSFFGRGLEGTLSWVPRAILAFRGGALSWSCGVYSLSDQ